MKYSMPSTILLLLSLYLFAVSHAIADVKVPALFSDNSVLQQQVRVPIWGTAEAGETVTVAFQGQRQSTVAGRDGKWMVKLDPLRAGGPFDMTIAGKNTITLRNVAVGEVWLASGQSNMEWPVAASQNAQQEIA